VRQVLARGGRVHQGCSKTTGCGPAGGDHVVITGDHVGPGGGGGGGAGRAKALCRSSPRDSRTWGRYGAGKSLVGPRRLGRLATSGGGGGGSALFRAGRGLSGQGPSVEADIAHLEGVSDPVRTGLPLRPEILLGTWSRSSPRGTRTKETDRLCRCVKRWTRERNDRNCFPRKPCRTGTSAWHTKRR